MPGGTRRDGKKGKSDSSRLDSSKGSTTSSYREGGRSSANSSYRDRSRNEANSSQDSQSLDDSQGEEEGDNLDYTDNASHFSRRSPAGSFKNSPSDHSPYSKSRQLLEDVEHDFYSSEMGSLHISPMPTKLSPVCDLRPRKNLSPGSSSFYSEYSPGGYRSGVISTPQCASSPLTRGPLHPKDRSPGSPLQAIYESKRPKKDNDARDKGDFISNLFALPVKIQCGICVMLCTLFFLIYFILPGKTIVDDHILRANLNQREVMVHNFEKYFKGLMSKFPAQQPRTWKILKAATKRVLKESEPNMPAVILLAADKEAFDTVDCLAKQFATIVAQTYSVKSSGVISQNDVSGYSDPEKLKLYLDKKLHNVLQNEKVVIVENIDKIAGQAAMIFHSYCDNEFAPFKDSVIILTMHIDSDDEITSDSDIENYLESKWENELDKDKRAALIYSRLGNNIAHAHKEDGNNLKRVCS